MSEEDYQPGAGDKIRIGLFYFAALSGVIAWGFVGMELLGLTSACY